MKTKSESNKGVKFPREQIVMFLGCPQKPMDRAQMYLAQAWTELRQKMAEHGADGPISVWQDDIHLAHETKRTSFARWQRAGPKLQSRYFLCERCLKQACLFCDHRATAADISDDSDVSPSRSSLNSFQNRTPFLVEK